MALTWQIDHRTRTVVATGEGVLRFEDFERALDEIARPATLSYRKLMDLGQSSPVLDKADMLDLAGRVRGHSSMTALGALAIVAVSEESHRQARLFQALDTADRPLRIFREIKEARDWLDGLPSSRLQRHREDEGSTLVTHVEEAS